MSEGDLFDNLPPEEESPRGPRLSTPPADEEIELREAETVEAEAPENPVMTVEFQEPPRVEPVSAPEPEPELVPERRKTALPRTGSLGQTLAELRRSSHMELADVADETRIKQSYLEALENDVFSDLPQMVYVLAYVKKLCGVYGVSAPDTEELIAGLREQLAYELPEDIDKSVICREQDEETRRKLQQISVALIAGAALIVLLLVIGGTTLILRSQSRKKQAVQPVAAEEQVSEEWLSRHRKTQPLQSTRLKQPPRS